MIDDHVGLSEYEYHLYQEARPGRMSRRDVLRRAAAAGLSAPLVSTVLDGYGVVANDHPFGSMFSVSALANKQVPQRKQDYALARQYLSEFYGSGNNQPWLTVPFGITNWAPRGAPSQFILTAFQSAGIWNSAHWKDATYTCSPTG